MSAVLIEGLTKRFGDHVVLPHFDLSIEEGEFVVLLGPSGCGKTTVLRCLAGLDRPNGGRISIGGALVEDVKLRRSVPTQDRGLGFVFQNYALWPHMTVWENVAYPLKMRRMPREHLRRKVADILALVGLEVLSQRAPSELSGGQQQRVALARALVASPQVLLLDEPLSNLDAQRRTGLRKELRAVHREIGTTTVYVTHDQIEALTMADRVLVMKDGVVQQAGDPVEVFERPGSRFVAEFLGYENIIRGQVSRSNGRYVTVACEAWGGELAVETALHPAVGAWVDLAFRAANVRLSDLSNGINVQAARIIDVTYLGDTVDYSMAVGAHFFTARAPAKVRSLAPQDGKLSIAIAPEEIVLLSPATGVPASEVAELGE